MNHRQRLGKWGEAQACQYLRERGFEILGQNIRTSYGELDMIARKDGIVVFVEVKTRGSRAFGLPEESITAEKREHLLNSAQDFLTNHPELNGDWRVDVIAIQGTLNGELCEIEWFENAIC